MLVAFAANAQHHRSTISSDTPTVSHGWSVLTGQTVGTGRDVLQVDAGFPGLDAKWLHGATSNMDIGGIFTFNYGVENSTDLIDPELKLNFVLKFLLAEKNKFNFGLEFDPGLAVFFADGAHFGPTIPIRAVAGLKINPQLNLDFGLDTGFGVFLTNGTNLIIPILFGGGLEYFVASDMAITFDLRMGPVIDHVSADGFSDTGSGFGMKAMLGVAFPFSM